MVGLTEGEIQELYECRILIETFAVRRVAEQIDAAGVTQLQALVDQMSEAALTNQPDLIATLDTQFHRTILTLAGNRRLLVSWEPHAGLLTSILGITNANRQDAHQGVVFHQELVQALAQHDASAAERSLQVQLQVGKELMIKFTMGRRPMSFTPAITGSKSP